MDSVREPLDKLNPKHSELDPWEIVMYVLGLAFSFDGEPPSSPSFLNHPLTPRPHPDLHKVGPPNSASATPLTPPLRPALQAPAVRLLAHARLLGRRLGDDGLSPHRCVRPPRRGDRDVGPAELDVPLEGFPVPELRRAFDLVSRVCLCGVGALRKLTASLTG